MRALLLIRYLRNITHHIQLQPQLRNPLHHARHITKRIHEKDCPLREGLHLGKDALDGGLRDLGGDGEGEFGALAELGLDPHRAVHERDEAFGDG